MIKEATSSELPPGGHRYDAFISYAHEDQKAAEWLSRFLSTFWVPWKRRRRVFLDHDSLPASGGLSHSLKTALQQSRFLIVCCSEDSVDSTWVDLEIKEFLTTHSPKNVLACRMGARREGAFLLPQALRSVEQILEDDLYKPDLRGDPERLKGQERRKVTRDALSLLAPMVGLPGKDELLDRRKKTVISCTALFLLIVSVAGGWKAWDNRPESQINKIRAEAPDLVSAIAAARAPQSATPQATAIADLAEDRHSVSGEWLRTLVLTGHSDDALAAARKIRRADARFRALIEIAEQQSTGGAIRHYVDRWGVPSWEIVREQAERSPSPAAHGRATHAANEAAETGTEVVQAARKIEGAASEYEVMVRVADALGKIGKVVEAKQAALEAVEAARHIEDASSRARALIEVVEALTSAEQTDDAAQIAAEAVRAAQSIDHAASRSSALSWIAGALAEAGQSVEAFEAARQIEDAESRSDAIVGIVEGLVKAAKYAEAHVAALQIDGAADRVKALAAVVQVLIKAGKNDEAMELANEALNAAERLQFDVQGRFTATARIIEVLAAVGRADKAREMLRARNPADRSRALTWIVEVLVAGGHHAEARRVADEAVAAARQIGNPADRPEALIDVAKALAESGSGDEVSRVVHEALAAAHGGSYRQIDAVVRLLNRAGKKEEARPIARRALAMIGKLPPGNERALALNSIDVPGLVVTSGMSPEVQRIARAALEATRQRKFEWEANRRWALVAIVDALARAGKGDEAVEAADHVIDPVTRIHALLRIAEELGRRRDDGKAKTLISAALRLAGQLTAAADKSSALSEVAKGFAKLHLLRSARETAASASAADKLAAYTVILREYAIWEDAVLRKLLASEDQSEPLPFR
ncbi:MAG: TIR domain-containing protein [Acidobacteriota bacterium]